ncbi:MAG: ATP synthase F1 subunit gamma [Chitinophagaceae bacterium]|nr:MAG: ATP synthase F1 subunit gamma [Chitinophagaceae bacterium]
MPANLKEVRNRIQSVKSTQQITKAMKMVSAAKLKRASDAIIQMRPYTEKLQEILSNIVSTMEEEVSLDFSKERDPEKVLLVLVTSDKGLCGGFNSNNIKKAKGLIENEYADQFAKGNVQLMFIGKKGFDYFKKNNIKGDTTYIDLFKNLNFNETSVIAEFIMEKFLDGTYDRIEVIYGKFLNAATQDFVVERFLPVPTIETGDNYSKTKVDYLFEPSKEEIIEELVPKILKTQLYKAVLDSNASEHGARMTAMDKATENAKELVRQLNIDYNRARQAAITTELSEIVGGAEALKQ